MSHITKVKTHLKDGVILRKALKKLGYQIEEYDLRQSREAKDLEFLARKVSIGVTPAEAGVQKFLNFLDSRLRGNDRKRRFLTFCRENA